MKTSHTTTIDVIKEFEDASAILKGHFILSSGLHSDTYMQCARALMEPSRATRLCSALAEKVKKTIDINQIDVVVSPAMGGVIVGFETARCLNKPTMFCERVEGKFELRRGFSLEAGQKVLVIEDVVTTGKSSIETFDLIKSFGAEVIAEAALIHRTSDGINPLGVPLITLATLDIKSYSPESLPEHLANTPAIKPGSRFLKK